MTNYRIFLSLAFTCLSAALLFGQDLGADTSIAGNDQVAEVIKTFGGRGTLADDSPLTLAEDAVKQFKMRDGFEIELVASEPEITQPLFATWDSRGRMWVVQYRQYQFPAGLKIIRYDQHLRAVFDKVPEPPPHGPKGADVITVCEDTDRDGQFDDFKDVITGLNIATSVQIGGGGIWVLQPPYLLFYPDADGDDVPDSDPEVHLSGFGLQDTHAVANSLTWGVDGWLYGANGSTTTCDVSSEVTKNVKFQGQCIWRYHPQTKVFEIYAEGGGNTFSLEIDAKGRVFSGTNNGRTRGMFYPQGSYGKKGWGKHGPLTNPYAFGYFQHMRHEGDNRRFAQAFCIYEGGLYPQEFDGAIIGPNSLHNVVWLSKRLRDTSTYRTVDEEPLVQTDDRWFRPVWCGVGPDGCVYLADWSDSRLSHVRPVDDWHKGSGRIYRVKPTDQKLPEVGALSVLGDKKSIARDLVPLFEHRNKWVRQRAVLEAAWRNQVVALDDYEEISPERLWAQYHGEGLQGTGRLLEHSDPDIRRITAKLVGSGIEKTDKTFPGALLLLGEMARTEPDVQVRSQLAATAKRIPHLPALRIIDQLFRRSEDVDDLHMPLMIWWAVEAHAESARERVLSRFSNPEVWKLPIVRHHIISRLMQRYAMAGGSENLAAAVQLLKRAPDDEARQELLVGLNRAFQGTTVPELPFELTEALEEYQSLVGSSPLVSKLRQGDETVLDESIKAMLSSGTGLVARIELAKALGETENAKVLSPLLKLVVNDAEHALQRVAMRSVARFDDVRVSKTILGAYNSRISNEHDVRGTANRVLASRVSWAQSFLAEIDRWHIRAEEVQPDVIQQLRLYEDQNVKDLVTKHFGKVSGPEKIAEMKRIRAVLRNADSGDVNLENGRVIFTQRCGACHKLFKEGGKLGPELTGYERGNLDFWLPGILDPNLEIREGFQSYVAKMKDGRQLIGMMAEQGPKSVTLRDAANEASILSRDDIETLNAIPTSLMPEGLLGGLTDKELRDLFAYLSRK